MFNFIAAYLGNDDSNPIFDLTYPPSFDYDGSFDTKISKIGPVIKIETAVVTSKIGTFFGTKKRFFCNNLHTKKNLKLIFAIETNYQAWRIHWAIFR